MLKGGKGKYCIIGFILSQCSLNLNLQRKIGLAYALSIINRYFDLCYLEDF